MTTYQAAFNEWNDKVPDDLMKKTFKNKNEAEKAVDDQIKVLDGKLKQACLELHKEGGSSTCGKEGRLHRRPSEARWGKRLRLGRIARDGAGTGAASRGRRAAGT